MSAVTLVGFRHITVRFSVKRNSFYAALRCDFTARDPLLAAVAVRVEGALLDKYLSLFPPSGMANIHSCLTQSRLNESVDFHDHERFWSKAKSQSEVEV